MPERKEPLRVILSDKKTLAKVRATMLSLSAKEVEDAIGALAEARSKMVPPVPKDFPADQSAHRHQATNYYVAWDFLGEMPSISFRSPAFGWLKFLIPAEQIPEMCEALMEAKAMSDQAKKRLPQ
ncbi:MAG TPA: hypothetical protein VM659_03220 [Dongiaceae bacterium]|nr:hypothetical protein [Dongiaceae bacterium]